MKKYSGHIIVISGLLVMSAALLLGNCAPLSHGLKLALMLAAIGMELLGIRRLSQEKR